jgi:hypothetical protein
MTASHKGPDQSAITTRSVSDRLVISGGLISSVSVSIAFLSDAYQGGKLYL